MKITKNIGMFLLAIYLIVDGLLGFGLNLGSTIFLLYIVALASGVFVLIGRQTDRVCRRSSPIDDPYTCFRCQYVTSKPKFNP
jgi:hypothetical protein